MLTNTCYLDKNMNTETNGSNDSLIDDEYLSEHTHLFSETKLKNILPVSNSTVNRKHSPLLHSSESMFNSMNNWHDIPSLTNPSVENNSELGKMDYCISSEEPDVHQIKKYIPNSIFQNGVNPNSVVGYHNIVLRTSHINDYLRPSSVDNTNYSGELINSLTHGVVSNSENQHHSKGSQQMDYLPSIQSGLGNCSYGITESSMLNTSQVSVESDSSNSSVSVSDPLTTRPFQTVCPEQNLVKLEEQAEQQWRESQPISDSDSDVDGHSDVCESLESLVDHGLDSDAPDSSAESDISDDESIDVHDDMKSYEDKDIGDGASLSSPEVSTTVPDDFTTISLTKDYYPIKEDPPIGNVGKIYPWLRFSLFPNMPPTINFRVMDTPPLNIPPEVKRILKWKSTAVTPAIVRRVLYNSGMRIVKRSRQWVGVWSKHMRANLFKTIKDFQKFNHFPGTFQIGRKDTLWRNHVRLRNIHGKKNYDFLPVTFIIPSDMKQLRHAWEKSSPHQMWIIKPPASARGTGIKIIHKFMQIPKIRPLIVQKYLSSPFLINGVKFDLRIYVYITSFYPLRIYIYKEGLARFASVMYSSCPRTVSDRYMHLTNYSVNRKSITYTANEDVNACKGHKWSLKALWGYLTEKGYDTSTIWNSIVDIVIKTIISCETTVSTLTRLNLKNGNSCHELFGFDIILDSNLKPWLLEVNISPSLQSTSKLDASIKGQMCRDLLNLSGITIPPHLEKNYQTAFMEKISLDAGHEIDNLCFDKRLYRMNLSIEERAKQVAFSRMERQEYLPIILQNLLPDDVRQLVIAEDERSRSGQYIRVFPSTTSYRYHKFFDRARYYNHLFDAWETQYSSCRQEGIQRLTAACRNGLHLKTVPKDSSKVSSPKAEIGRISSSSSLRIRCCSRSATNRAIQRACRSARNLFARMKIQRHRQPISDLEDLSKSSNAGSGDHLLKSKINRETEDYYYPINSPQNSTPSNENKLLNKMPQKNELISSPVENHEGFTKDDSNYYIKKPETNHLNTYLNSENSAEDKLKYSNTSTMPNGVVINHHCRGCALLSQGYYLSNNLNFKKEYKLIENENPSPSTLVERVPIHSSQIKGRNNHLIKDGIVTQSNFTSN